LHISVNVRGSDILVSFDVVTLLTNIPAEEVLEFTGNKLLESDKLAESSVLEVDAIMELLEVCLKTTHFEVDSKFFPPPPKKKKKAWLWGALCLQWKATTFWGILKTSAGYAE
jgi:hypothetical protein